MMLQSNNTCLCAVAALVAVIATTTHAFTTPLSQTALINRRTKTSLDAAIVARNGLSYEDIEIGTGRNIFPGDAVLCYYVGTYQEGGSNKPADSGDNPFFAAFAKAAGGSKTVTFDETQPGDPAEVLVGKGRVIQGWDIGICGDPTLDIPPMKIGGDRKLIIPAALAYGESGAGDAIPPNTDLEFQIAIVNAERADPGLSDGTKLKGIAGLVGFLAFMGVFGFVVTQNIDKLL